MRRHLYAFGSNGEGQLGFAAADIVDTPAKVPISPVLEDICDIIGGYNHTLLRTRTGQLWGCGDNRKAQLCGHAETLHSCLSMRLLMDQGVEDAAAASESLAQVSMTDPNGKSLNSRTVISTRGSGKLGELGRGPNVHDFVTPTPPIWGILDEELPSATVSLAAGVWHYVLVLADGSVYGWGKARLGQLGSSLTRNVFSPTKIEDISFKPVKVICGKDFTYLVSDPGIGEHIVLGKDKFNIVSDAPSHVKGWKDIGATWHAIFVLFEDGSLTAWGRNSMWQLVPPQLPPLEKIAVGSEHVFALTRDGKLISWGWGKHGNCGNLGSLQSKLNNDMLDGIWNEIKMTGEVEMIAAGYCTSFVVTKEP